MSFLRPLPLLILAFFWLSGASAKSPTQPGDRVAVVGNTYADQLRIHGYLETLLLHHLQVVLHHLLQVVLLLVSLVLLLLVLLLHWRLLIGPLSHVSLPRLK
jgi:hypothetical protein